MRFPALRAVGKRIRQIVDGFITDESLDRLGEDITSGVGQTWVAEVRSALCKEFGARVNGEGLQEDLWRKLLGTAGDFDAVCLPDWIKDGFPLGIKHPIENTGIFISTELVSEAVLESKLHGHLMGDAD